MYDVLGNYLQPILEHFWPQDITQEEFRQSRALD